MFQELIPLPSLKRIDQEIHKFCAKSQIALTRAARHLSAKLPALSATAHVTKAAVLSGSKREMALSAARTKLGDAKNVSRPMRRILPKPGGGRGAIPRRLGGRSGESSLLGGRKC